MGDKKLHKTSYGVSFLIRTHERTPFVSVIHQGQGVWSCGDGVGKKQPWLVSSSSQLVQKEAPQQTMVRSISDSACTYWIEAMVGAPGDTSVATLNRAPHHLLRTRMDFALPKYSNKDLVK